ncbi:hypothetical protein Nepgr_016786 [Nepenthes gracilis]|uniref:Uncharacterized protein n=1 Tax=Nepenthes gracilis TaxID=150966 RepID=A0AAD3SN86_NEPGR|nr:hypothetical protein Nepgr_016786 [Nepenthes gracilis]
MFQYPNHFPSTKNRQKANYLPLYLFFAKLAIRGNPEAFLPFRKPKEVPGDGEFRIAGKIVAVVGEDGISPLKMPPGKSLCLILPSRITSATHELM